MYFGFFHKHLITLNSKLPSDSFSQGTNSVAQAMMSQRSPKQNICESDIAAQTRADELMNTQPGLNHLVTISQSSKVQRGRSGAVASCIRWIFIWRFEKCVLLDTYWCGDECWHLIKEFRGELAPGIK